MTKQQLNDIKVAFIKLKAVCNSHYKFTIMLCFFFYCRTVNVLHFYCRTLTENNSALKPIAKNNNKTKTHNTLICCDINLNFVCCIQYLYCTTTPIHLETAAHIAWREVDGRSKNKSRAGECAGDWTGEHVKSPAHKDQTEESEMWQTTRIR